MDSYSVLLGLKPANYVFDVFVAVALIDAKTHFSNSRPKLEPRNRPRHISVKRAALCLLSCDN